VVPTMLINAQNIEDLVEALEVRFLANRDENLHFGLLTDFRDAHEETIPEDEPLASVGRAILVYDLEGQVPVNTDGGLKCFGHPLGASGLRMIYEVYKQMQGKAGPRQRKNPTLGLTHNFGMNPGSGIGSITILGQRD